jgi:hypothetical protein
MGVLTYASGETRISPNYRQFDGETFRPIISSVPGLLRPMPP